MRARRVAEVALLAALGCALPVERADKAASRAFAQQWLERLDAGDRAGAFQQVSRLARARGSEEELVRRWFGMREPLGAVVERSLQTNWRLDNLPSAPDGNYRELIYWSKFEHKDFVQEGLLLAFEDGGWKLITYRVH